MGSYRRYRNVAGVGIVLAMLVVTLAAWAPMPPPIVQEKVELAAVTATPPAPGQFPWPMPPDADKAQPGGTLRVPVAVDLRSLDPVTAVDWNSWIVVMNGLNNCLYNFGHNMALYPDLAEDWPTISSDGKAYTIKIRPDVKFHNGRELEASDFKYSIERAMWPETKGWGAEYMKNVVGAQEVISGTTKTASGIEVVDKYTLAIALNEPQFTFIYQLAQPYNCPVAKEDVEKWGEDFARHGSGTGPYMLDEWVTGQRLVLVKNPNYFHPGKPYIDRIEYTVGVAPEVALMKLEAGEVDLLHDMIPPGELARVLADPALSNQVVSSPTVDPVYLAMNVNVAPFDNVLVRQAVAHAVNTENLIRIIGGQGEPIEGILPTGFPGQDPALKWYEYDPAKAKDLLGQAGLKDGFSTTLYTTTEDPNLAKVAAAIQQDLAEVGIKIELNVQVQDVYLSTCEKKGACPMSVGSWVALWGDPSGLLVADQCSMKTAPNLAQYCNQKLEDLLTQAEKASSLNERMSILQNAVKMVRDDVPRFGLYTRVTYSMKAPNLQGVWVHPTARWFFEDFWFSKQ
jgi:peptide/nickel transport system substrate-binding protein/oligopeptide transport system substrate-binding protein